MLQSKNIPNLLLKSTIEIDFGNKIKIKLSEERTIDHGVRQGCPSSPTLFNIYMNRIIVKWYQIYTKGINLSTGTKKHTLLFAYNQVTVADSEESTHITKHNKKILEWKYHQKNLR
jgi:hypothetical protein